MADEQRLGTEAQALLDGELFARTEIQVRLGLFDRWCNTPPEDTEGRERIHRLLLAWGELKSALTAISSEGKALEIYAEMESKLRAERARERERQEMRPTYV